MPNLYRQVSTDSTFRWTQLRDAGEWFSRRGDVLTGNLGGYGRSTAVMGMSGINSGSIRWYGVSLTNPVTRQWNTAKLPIDHTAAVYEQSISQYELILDPQSYRIVKPLSAFQFEQSSFNYRVLDGMLAAPVNDKLHFQGTYQGQKEDGRYPRSTFEGRRSLGEFRYDLHPIWTARAFWLYQGAEMDESLGYQLSDPEEFGFDRFRSVPISNNSRSMRRQFITGFHLQHARSAPGDGLTISRNVNRHEWRSDDTTAHRVVAWGLYGSHTFSFRNRISAKPYIDLQHHEVGGNALMLPSSSYGFLDAGIQLDLTPISMLTLTGKAGFQEAAGQNGYAIDVGGKVSIPKIADLTAVYGMSREPQPYVVRYAAANGFTGNTSLNPLNRQSLVLRLEKSDGYVRPFVLLDADQQENIIALSADSHFVSIDKGQSRTLSAGLSYDRKLFEFSASYASSFNDIYQRVGAEQTRQQLQASAFVKGPVLKSAAYLKAGFYYRRLLNDYYAPLWIAEYGMWVHDPQRAEHPAHDRLDLEFSARVRSLIITGRLENTLDGWLQKGYFDVLPYPMPSRRFRFGLRVVFRD